MLFNTLVYVRLKPHISHNAAISFYSTMPLVPTILHIDLTSKAEQCALCSSNLGEGNGKASLVYVLKDCRCVSLLLLI